MAEIPQESLTYEAALDYLKSCTKFGMKLGLERISAILERLGQPQRQFRIIHIAGTNGKGSTTAMFEAVLRAAGFKTGRFTSPHLMSYRERFAINGEPIAPLQLAEVMSELKPVIEAVVADGLGPPTEFEVGTALGLTWFARQQVDWAVIEVGMGGRFDATNAVEPELSVIAHIALDHQEYLGDTLEKIAFEKAGIIKRGVPVVLGIQDPEVETYLSRIAAERDAVAVKAGELAVERVLVSETGTCFTVDSPAFGALPVKLALIGRHQVDNCRNVIAGCECLLERGVWLTREQVLEGLNQAVWPGRFERVASVAPLKLYLDGTHNPDGVRALVQTIKTVFPGQKVDLLFGKLNNRSSETMAALLAEVTQRVITTNVPDPKTTPAEELAAVFRNCGIESISEPDPARALDWLLQTENSIAVATGSLYLTGFLRSLFYPELK